MLDDDGDDPPVFREPLPADDRLWRHPSELGPAPRSGWRGPWAVAVMSGMIGAVLAGGLVAVLARDRTTISSVEQFGVPTPVQTVSAPGAPSIAADIAQKVRPAVTRVIAHTRAGTATGSAVMFRTDGHLLTNEHVVAGADLVRVVLADGKVVAADVVGSDGDTDLAVLKIGGAHPSAVLGSAAALKVGQYAMAFGPSASAGIISALHRRISAKTDGHALLDMIQTDAPIVPDASGGPLLDSSGLVIGITTTIAAGEPAELGFATPIDVARAVGDELIAHGRVTHPWIGLDGQDVEPAATEPDLDAGAVVGGVVDGSPAAKAGLRPADVVVAIDGAPVRTMAELVLAVRRHRPGEVVALDVVRNGVHRTVRVVLAERPRGLPA